MSLVRRTSRKANEERVSNVLQLDTGSSSGSRHGVRDMYTTVAGTRHPNDGL